MYPKRFPLARSIVNNRVQEKTNKKKLFDVAILIVGSAIDNASFPGNDAKNLTRWIRTRLYLTASVRVDVK